MKSSGEEQGPIWFEWDGDMMMQKAGTTEVKPLKDWEADGTDYARSRLRPVSKSGVRQDISRLSGNPVPTLVQVRKSKTGEWINVPPYCSQNGGDCLSCSLVSYGRDCQNEVVA